MKKLEFKLHISDNKVITYKVEQSPRKVCYNKRYITKKTLRLIFNYCCCQLLD